MPARSIATGTISFGLVTIPVKLYSATQPSAGVSFNLLHAKDGSRLKQQYVCAKDGEKVERDEMVKGYEFAKDQYVTFTAEELKVLEETASQAIEIAEFVPAEKVDPIYFDKAYYLGPDKGGDKAYRLLSEALRRSGKAALARYAARGKQYLVLIRPVEGRLVMQQLLYQDEVRSFAEVPVADVDLKEPELQLALRLIEQTASTEFNPRSALWHDLPALNAYVRPVASAYLQSLERGRRLTTLEDEHVQREPGQDVQAEQRDELARTLAALQKLPESDRAALLMHAEEEMSYQAIADALGISLAAVKVKIHRARIRLAQMMEDMK